MEPERADQGTLLRSNSPEPFLHSLGAACTHASRFPLRLPRGRWSDPPSGARRAPRCAQELTKQLEEQKRIRKTEEDAVIEASAPKARLIIVANRLPVTPRYSRATGDWTFDRSSGGLVSAFLGVKNMEITWVGWVGMAITESERPEVTAQLAKQEPFSCVPIYRTPLPSRPPLALALALALAL